MQMSGLSLPVKGVPALLVLTIPTLPSGWRTSQVQPLQKIEGNDCYFKIKKDSNKINERIQRINKTFSTFQSFQWRSWWTPPWTCRTTETSCWWHQQALPEAVLLRWASWTTRKMCGSKSARRCWTDLLPVPSWWCPTMTASRTQCLIKKTNFFLKKIIKSLKLLFTLNEVVEVGHVSIVVLVVVEIKA